MNTLTSIMANPIVRGAISGTLAAAVVDFNAFRAWKNVKEVYAYDWPTALLRWLQGAASGAIAAAGLSAIS